MATGSTSSKRGKVFNCKKRDSPPPIDEVYLDSDDDDFKPSKHSFSANAKTETKTFLDHRGKAKNKNTVITGTKRNVKQITSLNNDNGLQQSKDEGVCDITSEDKHILGKRNEKSVVKENISRVPEKVVEVDDGTASAIEELVLLDELESGEDNYYADASFNPNGKEAWKSLMSQMQKNQKESEHNNTKGKSSTKRGLIQSPKAKLSGKISQTQSPAKKNARLGHAPIPGRRDTDALREHTNGIAPTSQRYDSYEAQKTQEDNLPVNDDSLKKSAVVASIFLPPAERKALQKAASFKSDTKLLLDTIIDSTSQSSQNSLVPDDPTQFAGNKVILNQYQPNTDPYEGKKTKTCPFYKKLPGVPFCVDAFNYGLIPGMEVYFLSHFHSDHYIGLTKKFCKTIICSHPTGNLVRMKLYVEDKCIRKLHMNKSYIVHDSEVILMDANHCPGSVMFLFRFKNGTITLHTGDFRYTPDMLQNPYLSDLLIDSVYLDTTYCSPQYDFPTQNESISSVLSYVRRHLEHRPQTLVLCGSYLIGKERVYFTLAEAIGSKVFGTYDKRKIIGALENKKFSSLLAADEKLAKVHVGPMFSINPKNLQEYLAKYPYYTNIIGIKPSGWQFSSCGSGCSVKTHFNGTVTVLGVPYSEHSSFSELKEFITSLKPKRVQPTVNVGNAKKREEMMQHIETWLSK